MRTPEGRHHGDLQEPAEVVEEAAARPSVHMEGKTLTAEVPLSNSLNNCPQQDQESQYFVDLNQTAGGRHGNKSLFFSL